ncbi:MAG: flagellin [Aestuariibacter sp.]
MINGINGSNSNASLLAQINEKQQTLLEKLASGKKVNSAADGAAAQQIIDRLTSQETGLGQALRNVYDGVSLTQVADAGLGSINDDVSRIRELTVQAGNGILSDGDRSAIQQEIAQLQENIQSTIDNTEFAGRQLLSEDGSINFQIGANAGQQAGVDTRDTSAGLADILSVDVTTEEGREAALDAADSAQEFVGDFRTDIGAAQNRFDSAARIISTNQVNTAAANSRIQDTDFAQTTSDLAAANVQSQASTAVQAQANQQQGQVLALLG